MIGLILALALASAAAVQQAPPPQPVRAAPAPTTPPPPMARPAQSFATGGIGGGLSGFQPLRPFGQLTGLPATGDAAPLCRAACAKAHNLCSGDEDCDTRWTQCVATCRGAK